MKKSGNKRITPILLVVLIGFALFKWAVAGDLNPVSGPSDTGSAMYTLDDIYNRLSDNILGTKRTGSFEEPSADPGSTGHTLDDIYNLAIPTQVPVTGQTTSYATGDDGNLQAGVPVPADRFTDNSNGTVTDNLTGLIWLKNANASGTATWTNGLTYANALEDGIAGLTDGSTAGDWRLPNIKELLSLIDYGESDPALPSGHPFTNVQSPIYYVEYTSTGWEGDFGTPYWTGNTVTATTGDAWAVNMYYGQSIMDDKTEASYVWPVRGGQ
jgi:hypothetical protein